MLAIFGMQSRMKPADPAGGGAEPIADGLGESAVTSLVGPPQTGRAHRITVGRSEPHGDTPEAAA
jgi:hypothetical protein